MNKLFAALVLISLIMTSCSSGKIYLDVIPDEVGEQVEFDMPRSQFEKYKGNSVKLASKESFRNIYLEEINGEHVQAAVYYFDTNNDEPLYELIIIYNTEELRDQAAAQLFGEPNYKETEWRFTRKPYNIWAWTHEKKLVITSLIPETEWYDENWD